MASVSSENRFVAPVIDDVFRARGVVSKYLLRTPTINYPKLDTLVGTKILVKHENYQHTGAFKVRGGVNLVSSLSLEDRSRGVITASTGNHGQSIAYAARIFGVRATVVVPEGSNPLKVSAIQEYGARLIHHGKDFDSAREYCESLAVRDGLRYVHSGNEPLLIAGVGTVTLEMLEDASDIETIIVPVGGGSGAAAACIVAKTMNASIHVIGVQSQLAPAAYRSWLQKKLLQDKMETKAEGLATRVAFELPQTILWKYLDDFVLVTDEEIFEAVALYITKAHTLAEPAGAASLAAALKTSNQLVGRTVGLVLTGANISMDHLKVALNAAK